MLLTTLAPGACSEHRALDGPSIIIATEGSGTYTVNGKEAEVHTGRVFFIEANQALQITAGTSGLIVARAFVEVA